eukprot:TRINITY_DN12870_c0_g1_i1.p1 TRINITY_DN12870_c0_g1~~TRINITY_DN12870_c0_g1_i1.p1  ORF type:complete len:947 (+),score=295.17 TRINITY_DN12870_c0_g1_i1:136-2976(+)
MLKRLKRSSSKKKSDAKGGGGGSSRTDLSTLDLYSIKPDEIPRIMEELRMGATVQLQRRAVPGRKATKEMTLKLEDGDTRLSFEPVKDDKKKAAAKKESAGGPKKALAVLQTPLSLSAFIVDIDYPATTGSAEVYSDEEDRDKAISLTWSSMASSAKTTVHFLLRDEMTCINWLKGLNFLLRDSARFYEVNPMAIDKRRLWLSATGSTSAGASLRKSDAKRLLTEKLNAEWSKAFDNKWDDVMERQKRAMTEKEFGEWFQRLKFHDDAEALWQRYVGAKKTKMRVPEFQNFLETEQKEFLSEEECERLFKQLTGSASGVSKYDFNMYLTCSSLNSALHPDTREVYQNMRKPFQSYHIATLYNSNEGRTKQNITKALKLGIRCFHFPLWGSKKLVYVGDPKEKLGQAPLAEVLELLKQDAWMKSKYPIILLIENHLEKTQQILAAELFKDILGFRIQIDRNKNTPEENKEKFLLAIDSEGELEPVFRGLCYFELQPFDTSLKKTKQEYGKNQVFTMVKFKEGQCDRHVEEEKSEEMKAWTEDFLALFSLPNAKSNKFSVQAWAQGIQLVGINFTVEDQHRMNLLGKFCHNGNCGYVLKPSTCRPRDVEQYKEWERQQDHKEQNPDQVYVRAANRLDGEERDPRKIDDRLDAGAATSCNFRVRIISGHNLPTPSGEVDHSSEDVPDPYVVIRVDGVAADAKEFRTMIIQNNGFNPMWRQEFMFILTKKEHAVISFIVKDKDLTSDTMLGMAQFPVSALRMGYRVVHLRNNDGGNITANPLLFVHLNQTTGGSVRDLQEQLEVEKRQAAAKQAQLDGLKGQLGDMGEAVRELERKKLDYEKQLRDVDDKLKDRNSNFIYINVDKFDKILNQKSENELRKEYELMSEQQLLRKLKEFGITNLDENVQRDVLIDRLIEQETNTGERRRVNRLLQSDEEDRNSARGCDCIIL